MNSETATATEQILGNEAQNGVHSEVFDAITPPDISHLITEDDEPVDNILSEKQQRLLTETLYASADWNKEQRTFIAAANVGIFSSVKAPPLVPDAFLSLDVEIDPNFDFDNNRAYFVWVFGKIPDVVVEIVSNRKGGEMVRKMKEYARQHITYYAVFDPFNELRGEEFVLYSLQGGQYKPHRDFWMENIGLGLRLWEGEYEGLHARWIRWCDDRGNLVKTGKELAEEAILRANTAEERANTAEERANTAEERANTAEERANTAEERAKRLTEQLRALGINPEE